MSFHLTDITITRLLLVNVMLFSKYSLSGPFWLDMYYLLHVLYYMYYTHY